MSDNDISTKWLARVKKLHAISESGLAFSPEEFDKERFEEISLIAREMIADLADLPIQPITDLITPHHKRYVTPQVEVRGAVFNDDKILLVQERSDGKWTLPGGYADVGLTPVQNIEKEIWEESGLKVSTSVLYSLRHKASGDYRPDVREFYKLYFLCQFKGNNPQPRASMETSDAGFFALDALPELSTGRVIERDITDAFLFHRHGAKQTLFE